MSFSGLIGKLFGQSSEQPADGLQGAADRMRQAIAKLPEPDLSNAPPEVVAMRTWLARPDMKDRVLAERVISYLLTGQPVDVLDELERRRGEVGGYVTSYMSGGSPQDFAAMEAKKEFAIHAVRHDEAMAIRFARVIAAGCCPAPYRPEPVTQVPRWLSQFVARGWHPELRREPISMATMERIVADAGLTPDILFQFIYQHLPLDDRLNRSRHEELSGIDGFLARHEAAVCNATRRLIDQKPAEFERGFTNLMADLAEFGLIKGGYLQVAFAVAATGKKVFLGAARRALAAADQAELLALLNAKLTSGAAAEKKESARLLAERTDAERRSPEQSSVETSPGARVIEAIDGSSIVIPPVAAMPEEAPLSEEQRKLLTAAVAQYNAADQARLAAAAAKYNAPLRVSASELTPADVESFIAWVERGALVDPDKGAFGGARRVGLTLVSRHVNSHSHPAGYDEKIIRAFLATDFTFAQAARLSGCCETFFEPYRESWLSTLGADDGRIVSPLAGCIKAGDDFRAALPLLAPLQVRPANLVINLLKNQWSDTLLPEPFPESVFHFLLDHLELFEQTLGATRVTDEALDPERAFGLLGAWPKLPASLAPALVGFGLTGHKLMRKHARGLLGPSESVDRLLVARLADTNKDVRAAAADWIGERKIASAEPALRKALAKEKSEDARAAILAALARIGADISDQFDGGKLRAEADKGLAKASLTPLDWFPYAAVPNLHWQDGTAVPRELVKWWIVLAEKLKNPAGNALFDLYLDRLQPADAAAFGLFLMQTFIARDTQSMSDVEARQAAEVETDALIRRSSHYAPYRATTIERRTRELMGRQVGCTENRGFLGLTVRAPGADAADLVRRYLKDNGHKVNPSKALLTALSRNPAPAAIQAVLAAANRLRQKTVEALARELIAQVAEERGWTPDELADRTIPSAGFDEAGEMALDCGPGRAFTAIYRGGAIELINPDGKVVKALPDARNEQEAPLVAAAKKALSTGKKEIKQVETIQQARLYEAMCVERTWTPEIWTNYLKVHPIAGKLCQRVVWLTVDADGAVMASFRLLDDGSLTGCDDEPVSIEGAAAIKLAHAALLPAEQSERWVAHLRDYEIAPLFGQFGTSKHGITPAPEASQVCDREGFTIDNQKLAKAVEKLGYERGEIGDGGGFSEYVKRFDGAGVRAVLKFTGSGVGMTEKMACAIETMSYERVRPGSPRRGAPLKLGQVPKILLAETINDLVLIAAAGTGFDQDWKKKTGW